MNYWNKLMESPEQAAQYMDSYGEGVGFALRVKLSKLIQGKSVLDVGAGPAWNYKQFKGVKYKALDYASYFVEGVKKKWPEIDYELGDVRDILEDDGSWDTVIVQDCLEHTNGYEEPLKEALRVASQRVIVTFWHLTEDDDHININPAENDLDGWGAWYSQGKWEKFLNKLKYPWIHESIMTGNHKRDIYIIDKDIGGAR